MSLNLGLSFKEKIYLFIATLPGKLSKLSPSYLREYNQTIAKIKSLGGVVRYEKRLVLVSFKQMQYKLRLGSTDFLVFDQVVLEKEYAPVVELIKDRIRNLEGFKIIDAGANAGFASLFFSKQFPSSQIISIEPDPSNFTTLKFNIDCNQLGNFVFPLQGGIWGKTCKLNLVNSFRDGREWSLNLEEVDGMDEGAIDAFSIEDIMKKFNFNTIDFLKIDIEGGEKNLFDHWSTDYSILKKVKFIALEIHDELADRNFIKNVLAQAGFEITEINETTFGVNSDFV